MLTLLILSALAAPAEFPVTIGGSVGALVGPPSVGAYGAGRLLIRANAAWAVEAVGSEGGASSDARVVGSIGFFGRFTAPFGGHVRAGFEHHHETPWEGFKEQPLGSFAGTGSGIRHRSGAEVAAGYTLGFGDRVWQNRLGAMAELVVTAMPDSYSPKVYVGLEVGAVVHVGRRRVGVGDDG